MSGDDVGYVKRLHQTVDQLTAPIAAHLAGRLMCRRGCAGCCVDDITVFKVEADVIRATHPEILRGAPAPVGGCAMLGASGECRVYASRPYVCRTQGLPLRWAEAGVEHRDICPLNDTGVALVELPADACWTLGPVEQRLAAAQERSSSGEGERVTLRRLFASASDDQANL